MQADKLDISVDLVRQLLTTQFPQWASLPLAPIQSPGTNNAIYRLGDDMAVRLPIRRSAEGAQKEFVWLSRIAPQFPVTVPVPVGLGVPDGEYPWHWSIVPWLPGETLFSTPPPNLGGVALDLAQFVAALHGVDAACDPSTQSPAAPRGIPIRSRDSRVRAVLQLLRSEIDAEAATAAWEAVLEAPDWDGSPVWIHGDLQPTNLLVENGRLTSVIDWDGHGMGDPAADLMPAWSFFDGSSREAYREALAVDEATWERGRGWALWVGLIALLYNMDTNPVIVEWARCSVDAVLGANRSTLGPGGPLSARAR